MRNEILARLTPTFQEVLNPNIVMTEDLDASQVEEWDSLNHISLIVGIENEFECEFTTEELAQMLTVGDFVDVLMRKDVAKTTDESS